MAYESSFDEEWECYLYENRMVGLKSTEDHTHSVDLQLALTVGALAPITLAQRSREYNHHFSRHHQFGKPFQDFPDQYQSAGMVKEGQDGETSPHTIEYEGEISEDYTALDSEIVYMDLRADLVVLKQREVSVAFEDTGDAPPEVLTIYFDMLNNEPHVKKAYSPADVILFHPKATRDTTEKLIIASPAPAIAEELYKTEDEHTGTLYVGVSDKSGFHHLDLTNPGGFQHPWQSYGVMDTSYPVEFVDGDWQFVELVNVPTDVYPTDNEYRPFWNEVGWSAIDSALGEAWNTLYETQGTAGVPVSLPVNVWEFVPGSFAFDTAGNFFGHLKYADATYTKLAPKEGETVDPDSVFHLGANASYYPVSPTS